MVISCFCQFLLILITWGYVWMVTDWQRWGRETVWFPMGTSTKTGRDLSGAGSISRHASSVDAISARRRQLRLCQDPLLDLCGQLSTALRSNITLVSVPAEDSRWRNWRCVVLDSIWQCCTAPECQPFQWSGIVFSSICPCVSVQRLKNYWS